MHGTKTLNIIVDDYGSFLGKEKGALVIKNRTGKNTHYPLFENKIGEIQIKSGNTISSGALATCGFWGINILVLTQRGNPVAVLKSLDDDSHVKTRVCQYKALENQKSTEIAKTLVIAKAQGYDQVLKKYGLKLVGFIKDDLNAITANDPLTFKRKLMNYEAMFSKRYFSQIFQLFSEDIRPEGRSTFLAYDGLNNTFNLAYEILRWKIHVALLRSHLEPYLGYLHSMQHGKPSLVCDFMEIYRYLMDDFIISFCKDAKVKDFIFKTEQHSNKKGKRQYLNNNLTKEFTKKLDLFFQSTVEIPRMKVGKKQEIETLINEEAFLFAKYLRGERTTWIPRIAELK
jgi:CRISPR-associated protein Cas1